MSDSRVEYRMEELDELYQLLLMLYFSQSRKRIVRCECCFGYFIPKSSRPTIYCDRVFNGKSCKAAGPGLKYLATMDRDAALRAYDTLRHRRAASFSEHMDEQSGVDAAADRAFIDEFEAGDVEARTAREAYLARQITAEEFLRRVGYDGEVNSTRLEESDEGQWRRCVERDINFDPWLEYPDMVSLDLTAELPQWEITPATERGKKVRGEHRSLRDRYGER